MANTHTGKHVGKNRGEIGYIVAQIFHVAKDRKTFKKVMAGPPSRKKTAHIR